MKFKKIILLVSLVALSSCVNNSENTIDEPKSELEQAILNLRNGFHMEGVKEQICLSLDKTELFRNQYSYDYSFENSNENIGVYQKYTYPYNGKYESSEISVVKDKEGYISQKYINYKNEVDYYRVINDEGYYSSYDDYFLNPFFLIEEDDLTEVKSEGSKKIYSLFKDKIDLFDYYLTGNSQPLKSLEFTFYDGVLKNIKTISSLFTGTTKDTETGYYYPCTWTYENNLTINNVGDVKLDSPKVSEENNNIGVIEALNKVGENFTLETSMYLKADGSLLNKKTSYFDGESYYIEMDKEDKTKNYLYHVDPFNNDGLLYEYKYDESSKLWVKSSNTSSSSYNIEPQDKSMFIPHLKEVSPYLFGYNKDAGGYYNCNNEYAVAFMGEGFFSDAENLSYFSLGYGINAKIKSITTGIEVSVDFYFPYSSSQYIEVTYVARYLDLGTTKLPEFDL